MGRRRQHVDPLQPLPRGLYRHRAQYRAKDAFGKWRYFRGPYLEVMRAYAAWRDDGPAGYSGSVAWVLDLFVGTACPSYQKAGRLAPRTVRDYTRDAEVLKLGLGKIPVGALTPSHVAQYRDTRAETSKHVRNELACLSAAMSYAVEQGYVATNPCLQVRRPSRIPRQRLITDAEYLKVYSVAIASVRAAMTFAVRTLALPADILALGPHNIVHLDDSRRILRFTRGKTGALIEIEVVGELARVVDELTPAGKVARLRTTFVRREDGKPYTVDGIGAMFRRYCGKEKANVPDFGLRDLRAKGATDMYRAGTPIRHLQHLLGHASEQTTRIYIKQFLPEVVRPNERPIVAVAE